MKTLFDIYFEEKKLNTVIYDYVFILVYVFTTITFSGGCESNLN